jgi:hypothetical protein
LLFVYPASRPDTLGDRDRVGCEETRRHTYGWRDDHFNYLLILVPVFFVMMKGTIAEGGRTSSSDSMIQLSFLIRKVQNVVQSSETCRVCILAAMGRKRIIAFAVVAIVAIIVCASIYETFDIHDTKPFPIDPEFLLMMLSSALTVCLSILLLSRPLFKLFSLIFGFVHHALKAVCSSRRYLFQDARLLFSPPLSPISLRI